MFALAIFVLDWYDQGKLVVIQSITFRLEP